jgi:hypothetical protein
MIRQTVYSEEIDDYVGKSVLAFVVQKDYLSVKEVKKG